LHFYCPPDSYFAAVSSSPDTQRVRDWWRHRRSSKRARAAPTYVNGSFTYDDAVIYSARANFSRVGFEFGNPATSPALPRQGGACFIKLAEFASAERKFRSDEGTARPVAPNRRAHPDTHRLTTHRSTAILAARPTGTLPVALTPAMKPHGPNNFQSTNREMSS